MSKTQMNETEWAGLLHDLNVEELNAMIRVARAIINNKSRAFKLGDLVKFESKHGGWSYGVITKLNPKLIGVRVNNARLGMPTEWKVARQLLVPVDNVEYNNALSATASTNK